MNSCIYEGWIRHRRHEPVEHAFRYGLFMMYLDLGELETVFRRRWLWSARRPALAWFRRSDHLGDPAVPLDEAVRDLVVRETGARPDGPVHLLTHLRYFGHCMNPVSFYYCWDRAGTTVETIVAEVHNTPWGERHAYVLPCSPPESRRHQFRFRKDFHVSPFMGMDQQYRWIFRDPAARLPVHMENFEDGRRIFDATMVLRRREISGPALARVLVRYPLMTVRVVAAIYWQAFHLWRKRCRFHPHPRRQLSTRASQ